jgi:hypothetical protein
VTGRFAWRAAPVGAAICAGLAAGVRWGGWPPLLPLAAGVAALLALAAHVFLSTRDRVITDATAAGLDEAASLGGELRSASWFAGRDSRSEWADYHLARAAGRLERVDWAQLYPPIRARRAKAATAAMAIAAVVLVLPVAGGRGVHAIGSGDSARIAAALASAGSLPPELRKQIEELLKKAEESSLVNNGRALTEAEVRDLLARLNQSPELKNAQERNGLADPKGRQIDKSALELKALAERAKQASEMASLSPEVRAALSEVADKLSEPGDTQPTSPQDPKDAVGTADAQTGDAAQSNKNGDKQEASVQAVKDASAGGGVGVVMMSSDDPKGAQEAGLGLGGASSDRNGGGKMPDFAAVLRKETIEAYKDDEGQKSANDLRSKTEKATATVAYKATSPATFDKGRATAPPAVPESRRTAVQTYFIRKP